jgi:hypothetical protein
MGKKHVSFINEATKRVNAAIHRIAQVGELAESDKFRYTETDVEQIFASLHSAVMDSRLRFSGVSKESSHVFRLSRVETLPKSSRTGKKNNWVTTFDSLAAKRDIANVKLRRKRSKPFASDSRADYLLKGVAKAMHLPRIPKGTRPASWALLDPKNVVLLDAKKAAQTLNPTLGKAPQYMINGRLAKMCTYAPEVSAIRAVRAPRSLKLPKSVDARHAVILFRQSP